MYYRIYAAFVSCHLLFYFIYFFASVCPQINRMKYWLVKPPTFPIVNLKLFQHLFYSELLFQYSETLSSVLSSFSSHGSKQPSELTLDIVHHSTSQFFSPYPEHTVKACTSHQGVMMAHSVTQGHLRHLWFSMLKVDTLYMPTQKNMVFWKYWQHLPKIDEPKFIFMH